MLRQYPTFKFDKSQRQWIDVQSETCDVITKNQISFISYNVWFEPVNWRNRLNALFDIFNSYSPDFICLQEVTEGFLRDLINKDFIRDNYYFSGNFQGGYDVLMLSKYKTNFYAKNFLSSSMGRKLLLTEINYCIGGDNTNSDNDIQNKENKNYENFFIGTSHFESLNNHNKRKEQLEISFKMLDHADNALLMGDFNFDSSWTQEEKNINDKYKDCWFEHQKMYNLKDEERFTMPASGHFPPWRPDRILYRGKANGSFNFELDFFEILGKNPIEQDNENNHVKTPSDHYGLYALLKLDDKTK